MNMFVTVADIVIVVVAVVALVVYLCHLGNFVCFSFSVCLFVCVFFEIGKKQL